MNIYRVSSLYAWRILANPGCASRGHKPFYTRDVWDLLLSTYPAYNTNYQYLNETEISKQRSRTSNWSLSAGSCSSRPLNSTMSVPHYPRLCDSSTVAQSVQGVTPVCIGPNTHPIPAEILEQLSGRLRQWGNTTIREFAALCEYNINPELISFVLTLTGADCHDWH